MQPKHQLIQEQVGIDGNGDIVVENTAGPSAAPPKMDGIGSGNMMSRCAHRPISQLYGEAHLMSFAPTTVNPSPAPKEHALGDGGQRVPILFILNECVRAPPAQVQMNDFLRQGAHH
jgi:hypothetical protein